MSRFRIKMLIASALHAAFLVWGTFFLLNSSYPYGDESTLIKWTSVLRNYVQKSASKPKSDRFLFINVAWDKAFIPKYDTEMADYQIGVEPITDRQKLLQFFQILNKYKSHQFFMCDVFFKDNSPYDSLLQIELLKTQKFCVSYHKKEDGSALDLPKFKVSKALADYETYDDVCLKFRIFSNDSLISVPLCMYQNINKIKFEGKGTIDFINGKTVLNSFILDHKVRSYDFYKSRADTTGTTYNIQYLGEMLTLGEEYIASAIKNKIIVLGDFENDVHQTIYGKMPGSVILLNAYLALEEGQNRVTWVFLVFLYAGFFFASYKCFDTVDRLDIWIRRTFRSDAGRLAASFLSYALGFAVMSIASYLLFNIHLTILVLSVYMNILEYVYRYVRRRRVLANEKEVVSEIPNV
jgi:hypothetical protein